MLDQVDIVTDFALIVIPACLLSDTRLPRKEKTLIIFLGSGSFLTLISVAILTFILYGPFIHDDDWNTVVDAAVHLTVCIQSTYPHFLTDEVQGLHCVDRSQYCCGWNSHIPFLCKMEKPTTGTEIELDPSTDTQY